METVSKQWLGLPLNLVWGYVAIAIFMTGDGFELAFLSRYITELGFSPAQSSMAFTLYGLAAAIAAWLSGVLAEIITPQKTMKIGFILWCIFHVLFLVFGLGDANYPLILLFYGIRGLAYPLFLYSFIVVIVNNVRSDSVSSALGWFWTVYSIGIGVAGSYIPSFTIPMIGEMGTLWTALIFCLVGGFTAMIALRNAKVPTHMQSLSRKEKFTELSRAATLLYTNKSILASSFVRTVNTLSLFGFAVIMPMMFVDDLGFTTSEWLQVWTAFFSITILSNVFWGVVSEKIGWIPTVRWFGCIGMAISSLAFYYIPQHFGHNFAMALVPAFTMGIFVAAFVPMAAIFPALEPNHKGAAISVYNLSAGLSNFLAPAIAVIILPYFGTLGVVIVYTGLYLSAFLVTYKIKVKQPGFDGEEVKEVELEEVEALS